MTGTPLLALGFLLTGSAAQALDCALVPLQDRVHSIMLEQANPIGLFLTTSTLGLGELSTPRLPKCGETDWTGNITCTATQTFTGTLFSVHGIADVQETPVQSLFYELGLDPQDTALSKTWHPSTTTPMLISFDQPVDGPLRLTHLDGCVNSLIRPATPELHSALTACHGPRGCPAAALTYLTSLNQSVF